MTQQYNRYFTKAELLVVLERWKQRDISMRDTMQHNIEYEKKWLAYCIDSDPTLVDKAREYLANAERYFEENERQIKKNECRIAEINEDLRTAA